MCIHIWLNASIDQALLSLDREVGYNNSELCRDRLKGKRWQHEKHNQTYMGLRNIYMWVSHL